MSIIYDALEKTQQDREKYSDKPQPTSPTPPPSPKGPRFQRIQPVHVRIAFVVLLAGLVFGMLFINRHRLAPLFKPKPVVKVVVAPKPKPKPVSMEAEFRRKHSLKGVFLSPQERLALIDNNMIHEGDIIDGMLIMAINMGGVTVKNDHEVFILPSPA